MGGKKSEISIKDLIIFIIYLFVKFSEWIEFPDLLLISYFYKKFVIKPE